MAEMRSVGMPLTDEKAEAAALGGMLVSEGHPLDCRDEVVERLSEVGARAFYNPDHQKIYQAIVDCMLGNEPTDPVAVVAQLRKKGELTQELMHLVHELPRHAGLLTGVIEDARTILDLHRRRELHRTLMDSDNLVLSATGSYEEVAGEVYGAVSDVVDSAVKPTTLFTSIEVVDAALGHLFGEKEIVPGIPTGINDLDELIGGLYPGQMIVLAGRPGHGKTTLGAQIARNLANNGVPTVFFSQEMPKEELGQRNASAETGVAFSKIREGKVSSKELEDLAGYVDQQEDKPLYVDDDPDQSVGEISLKTRKLVRERGV